MYRTCYKLLLYFMVLTFALASSTLAGMEGGERVISAYFDPPLNEVTAPPPNYNLIDSSIFEGVPPFAEMSDYELGGYYLYWDKTNGRWTLCSVVVPGGQLFEQLHGSILVQMEQEPVPGVNVWPLGFVVSDDLAKNDRWGWVKWPESIAPNLYEIWWDYTVDYTRLEKNSDYQDTIGICFTGCAFDFNIWASGHFKAFQPNQLKLGAKTTPISELAGFSDSYDGVDDKYQGETSVQEANTSLFTQKDLPGKTYNANGQIFPGTPYGDAYGKNIAYEGNGIQFSVATCAVETSPDFDPPLGQATPLTICLGETIYDTITAVDPDEFDTVTISIISGPGTLTGEPGNPATAYYEFTPNTPGNYTVVYEAVDLSGLNYVDSVTYQVSFNQPPKASASDSLVKFCWDLEAICYTVSASDDGDDPLTFTLLNGPGGINPVTGELCFTPTDPGAYDFSVEVSDGCGADTVLFSITVLQNNDPAVIPFDTLIQICGPPDSICFDITAFDPDLGDSLVISLISGPGLFELTGNGTGRQCFLPENADSTRYVFQYSVTDECWREIWGGKLATPPAPPQDSIVIIVVGGTSPEITCPDPIDVNLCAPDSVCYDIGIIPADANVVVTGDAVYANGKLCFYASATGQYQFTITVTNDCGAVVCNPIFNVTIGTPPEITCPDPVSIDLCAPDSVCYDIGIIPADANVVVTGDAVYASGKLCFYASATGQYQFTITASNECGEVVCNPVFNVTVGTPPEITCPDLVSIDLCAPDSVCYDIGIIPSDANVVVTGDAVYANGKLCFYASATGQYQFTITATNECGEVVCYPIFNVTVGTPPEISCPDPVSIDLCAPDSVCYDIGIIPADANVVVTGDAVYTNGKLCFYASATGQYQFTITATNDCGEVVCNPIFNVTVGTPPEISCPDAIDINLCAPDSVCYDIGIIPADANVVVTGDAVYANGKLCFYASATGQYQFTITATNECGEVVCYPIFNVTVGTPPEISCPDPVSIDLCAPDSVCYDIGIIPADANVVVTGDAVYANGKLCFYASATGQYQFTITVTNDCGEVVCNPIFNVTVGTPPEIACPDPIDINLCGPDSVCFDIGIIPSDANVVVTGDAVYANGKLCFYASATGQYQFTITATNDCGEVVCNPIFNVTVGTPPEITCPDPIDVNLCAPDSVCYDIGIIPADANVVVTGDAIYANGKLCFYASATGQYQFTITATNECGEVVCNPIFNVTVGIPPEIACPDPIDINLCAPDSVCYDIGIIPADANVVVTGDAVYENGKLCFYASATGQYQFTITVTNDCGEVVCNPIFNVTVGTPPEITCPDPVSIDLCALDSVCYDIEIIPSDANVVVTGDAVYANGKLCFYASATGQYQFTITVTNDCGEVVCNPIFNVTVGTPPEITCPDPISVDLCAPDSVCYDIGIIPADANIVVTGDAVYANGKLCFYASATGQYQFTITATNDCGEVVCNPIFNVTVGIPPEIACPDPIDINLCAPDSVCYDIGIIPSDANVVVTGDAVYANGKLCFYAEQTGIYGFTITATNDCGEVICNPIFNVTVNQAPVIKEIGDIDIIYCDMTELCLDLNLSDPDSNIYLVQLYGDCDGLVYDDANDQICIALAGGIDCQLNVMVTDSCGLADTMSVKIRAVPNSPPTIQLPSLETVVRCVTDSVPIVIDGFCVFDPEYDELVVTLDSGSGEFSFNDVTNCGSLTFTPPDNDSGQYCFRFMVADVCDTIYAEYCMNVVPASVCSSCVSIEIVTPPCTNTGGLATVNIFAEAVNEMAGYDLLLAYDGTALTFTRAIMGEALPHWEFFTYRFGANGNCSGDCPSGMLRLVAIADVNNGAHHPPQDEYLPSGPIASITFRVSSDLNLGGQYIPIEFFWFDCGDNSASDPSGQFLYIDQVVLGPEGNIIWDEANNDAYPESNRYDFIGAPDECLIGEKELPVRCIDFQNGALCITHPDSVDARGDLNLNGVAYEIADAVVYTNFFISGISAFTISVPGQIAASDINADGKTLSIADLVYLVRIITGDAPPFPKLSVDNSEVLISTKAEGKITTVSIDASQDIGAALLVFNAIGTTGGTVRLVGSHNMDMMYGWVDGTLRVLIYSFDAVGKIEAGQSALLEVVSSDGGGVVLVEAEMADYYANEISVKIASTTLPSLLELTQNHPNPFNPTTTFMMYLPFASDYTVTIFNVTGQRIKKWSGYGHAGYIEFTWDGKDENGVRAASGIYLYRAHAAGSEAIRKMVLLK